MKVLYYDCFTGISGDMNLGALIDLGVDESYLLQELAKLNIRGYSIEVSKDNRRGITGTRVNVNLDSHLAEHQQHHHHEHHHHHLSWGNIFGTQHAHHHSEQRNFEDIKEIILHSLLSEGIKSKSINMFEKIAMAEAKVHGKPINEVHFHEVGAVDSIVDMVGAAICLDFLKVDLVMSSSVQVGGGFVHCQHGKFPVPAPATAEILHGIPIKTGLVNFETTTPTGAAILASNVSKFTDSIDFTISKTGYGIGHKDFEVPNVLRVYLGELNTSVEQPSEKSTAVASSGSFMLDCNIDDMNPEIYDYIMEMLFEKGAEDVFLSSIIMKKSRPATKLSVLCSAQKAEELMNFILSETTTLGVRKYSVEKKMLARDFKTIQTQYGEITIKYVADSDNQTAKYKAEYNDCKKAALLHHVPLRAVYEEITRIMNNQ
jgi:pyridinium-3,5-bisthiocarboxylic acid mononucleotide nickel chelatase